LIVGIKAMGIGLANRSVLLNKSPVCFGAAAVCNKNQ
jgi:hypothetical protein